MTIRREQQKALEGLLVRQFRVCQALYRLTKDERLALACGDVVSLLSLSEHKETLLNWLIELQHTRRLMLQSLGAAPAQDLASQPAMRLADIIAFLEPEDARRLVHLQEGIFVLTNQVRELTQGNRSLAAYSLQRASALESHLSGLWQRPPRQVPGASQAGSQPGDRIDPNRALEAELGTLWVGSAEPENSDALPALFAAIIAARDALNDGDSPAVSAAICDLQRALEKLSEFLESKGEGTVQREAPDVPQEEAQPATSSPLPARSNANLVEVIADLYQQETAYQAVLKVSQRVLAGA